MYSRRQVKILNYLMTIYSSSYVQDRLNVFKSITATINGANKELRKIIDCGYTVRVVERIYKKND
jgi:hypothetical protein